MHDKSQLPDVGRLDRKDDGRPLVVGIGGSTRHASRSLRALQIALEGADQAGAAILLFDIHQLDLPMFDAEHPDYQGENVRALFAAVRSAQALIVGAAVYTDTVSGALKNLFDYLSILEVDDPPGLTGRVVGRLSVALGLGTMGASMIVETICRGLGAWVLPDPVDLAGSSFDEEGHLCDVVARDRLLDLGRRVTAAAIARREAAEPA